jgi:serine/threonine protein kinase
MAKNGPWTDLGFERGVEIPGGNQGFTFLARRLTDPPDEFNYVLKKLKHQKKIERRALFRNEVVAMNALDHKGVAKLMATNADQFREDGLDLFLITERINGTDLERLVDSSEVSFEDAIRVTINVLGILAHCHERGVVHRDIKPCHVILRNNSADDPVLIDFGIAYNLETQLSDAETKTDEGRGNRFLIGPEHAAGNPAVNRNPITDICGSVGLLFFALTGQCPRILRDTDSKKPHERVAIASRIAELSEWKRKRLLQVFDFGFEWEPSRRWQSIDRLIKRLVAFLAKANRLTPISR